MSDDDFEIKEPDEFSNRNGESFSHSQLVMLALRKCIEAGCKEMRAGYWNEKKDKFGNNILTYNPDTRKEFIESVETLMMVMADDFDEEFEKEIKEIETKVSNKNKEYCLLEERDWQSAPVNVQIEWKRKGIVYIKDRLNINFPYWIEFLSDKVSFYRQIVKSCVRLTKRMGYYREEIYTA